MRFAILFAALSLVSCNGEQDRPEVVNKLRTLGVGASPSVVIPSTTDAPQVVTLTVHALMPAGDQIFSAKPYIDEDANYSYLARDLVVNAATATYEEIGQYRYYKVTATFTAPTAEVLAIYGGELARLRYGIDLESGAESERIVGDVLLVPPGSTALSWQPVKVNLVTPAAAGETISGGTDLQMEATHSDDDAVKYSWYVTSGEIKNRRARQTKWEKVESGDQIVVATVRGSKSRSFDLIVRQVKGE